MRREVEGGLLGAVWRTDVRQQRTVPGAKKEDEAEESERKRGE